MENKACSFSSFVNHPHPHLWGNYESLSGGRAGFVDKVIGWTFGDMVSNLGSASGLL